MAVQLFDTNGANYDVFTDDIVKWLERLEKKQPFLVTGVSGSWVEGKFLNPMQDVKNLAKRMYRFCPDIVDQGCDTSS